MTRSFSGLALIIAMLSPQSAPTSGSQSNDATTADVRAVVDRYVRAVNDADENILRELWQPESVSYVNPMQRLRSWGELQGFWQGFLKNVFTRRELKPSNVAIQTAGDVAWAVFDWEFTAVQKDGKPYQARGWETQVYRRTDRGWRISHVHYSIAAAPPGSGAQAGQ